MKIIYFSLTLLGLFTYSWLLPNEGRIFFAVNILAHVLWLHLWFKKESLSRSLTLPFLLIVLIGNFIAPLILENDPYRYFAEAKIGTEVNIYKVSISEFEHELANEVYASIPYADMKSIYPPLAHLYLKSAFWISDGSFQNFLYYLKALNLLILLVSVSILVKSYFQEKIMAGIFPLILMHPSFQLELIRNAHFDAILVLLLVIISTAKPLTSGAATIVGMQVKVFSIFPSFLRGDYKHRLYTISALSSVVISTLFFRGDLLIWFENFRTFGSSWEMNSGTFRLIRNIFELRYSYEESKLFSLCVYFVFFSAILLFLKQTKKLKIYDKIFYAYFLVVILSPVVNPWYLTWALPFAFIGANSNKKLILYLPLGLYYGFWAHGRPDSWDYDPTWFNVEHVLFFLLLIVPNLKTKHFHLSQWRH